MHVAQTLSMTNIASLVSNACGELCVFHCCHCNGKMLYTFILANSTYGFTVVVNFQYIYIKTKINFGHLTFAIYHKVI